MQRAFSTHRVIKEKERRKEKEGLLSIPLLSDTFRNARLVLYKVEGWGNVQVRIKCTFSILLEKCPEAIEHNGNGVFQIIQFIKEILKYSFKIRSAFHKLFRDQNKSRRTNGIP